MLGERQRVACGKEDRKLIPRIGQRHVGGVPLQDRGREQRIAGIIRDHRAEMGQHLSPDHDRDDRVDQDAGRGWRPRSRRQNASIRAVG